MKKIYNPYKAIVVSSTEAIEVSLCTIYTNDDVSVTLFATDNEKTDGLSKLSVSKLPLLPSSGTIKRDSFYNYSGTIVYCIQEHERTIYTPEQTPALFTIYRVNADNLEWAANEKVLVGWKRVFKTVTYVAIQAHTTVIGQTPDITPALWNVVPTSSEWASGVAYKIGNEVTYLGKAYTCIQEHTSNVSWTPVATINVLWKVK